MHINKIQATNMEMTDAIKAYVEEKFATLEKFMVRFEPASLDIEVGKTTEHHQKGMIFKCEVNAQISGDMLRVNREDEDLYAAIDRAKDELKEQLAAKKEEIIDQRKGESGPE